MRDITPAMLQTVRDYLSGLEPEPPAPGSFNYVCYHRTYRWGGEEITLNHIGTVSDRRKENATVDFEHDAEWDLIDVIIGNGFPALDAVRLSEFLLSKKANNGWNLRHITIQL